MTFTRTADWTMSVIETYRSGATIKHIADRLGPSFGTVQRELLRAGVKLRGHGSAPLPKTIVIPTSLVVRAYVAGLFDGEGNIYWRRRTNRTASVRCAIYSTTPELMDWLGAVLGGSVRWDRNRERKGWKPMGIWEVHRAADAFEFLTAVRPFLIIKAAKADEALVALRKPLA